MRIVLVGAPGTGKGLLAQDLHMALKNQEPVGTVLPIAGSSNDYMATFGKAVGILADYRVELSLAVRRAFAMQDNEDAIFEGSLLDSVAYSVVRYKRALEDGSVNEQIGYNWWLIMNVTAAMLRDTWRADHVVYIKPADADDVDADLDEALTVLLRDLKIKYTEVYADALRDEEESATIVKMLIEEINGSEKGTSKQINE